MTNVDNTEDLLDSRDIIKEFEYLENTAYANFEEKHGEVDLPDDFEPTEYLDEDEADQYRSLKELIGEGEGYPDWNYGATLIRDSYFKEYAKTLAEDIGGIDREAGWPAAYIDWTAAADALKQDYSTVEYDGVDYWIHD